MPKQRETKIGFEHLKGLTIADVKRITKSQGIDPDKASDSLLRKINRNR